MLETPALTYLLNSNLPTLGCGTPSPGAFEGWARCTDEILGWCPSYG